MSNLIVKMRMKHRTFIALGASKYRNWLSVYEDRFELGYAFKTEIINFSDIEDIKINYYILFKSVRVKS